MWRLRWFAHALVTPSARLFDANIFSPELRTLALSDAMFVEGIVARAAPVGGHEAGARAQPAAPRRDGRIGRGDVRARAIPHREPRRRRHRRHRVRVRAVSVRARDAHGAAVGDVDAARVPRPAPRVRHRRVEVRARHGRVHRPADAVQHLLRHLPRQPGRARRRAAAGAGSAGAAAGARWWSSAAAPRWRCSSAPCTRSPTCASTIASGIARTSKSRPSARARPATWWPRRPTGSTAACWPRAAAASGGSFPERSPSCWPSPACCCAPRRAARSSICCSSSPPSRRRSGSAATPTPSCTITFRRFASCARRRDSGSAC